MFTKPLHQELAVQFERSEATLLEHCDGSNESFQGLKFRDRHLRWVRLTDAQFRDCDFRESVWDCVFAEFALFERCRFDRGMLFDSVFAGSRFVECSFLEATAEMCNFNGVAVTSTDFSNASLRRSRFINSRFYTAQFVNCDIKDALFQFSERNEVIFKHSNYEEACF